MYNLYRVLAAALCFGSAGCAIHPLPEDVTGVTTYEIVRRVRCEAKQAVFDIAVYWLIHDEKVDPASRAIGLQFADGSRPMETLSPKLFPARQRSPQRPSDRALLELFWNTGVAYNYELDMEEKNDFRANIDVLKPLYKGGKFNLGLNAQADRRRENTRIFTITDTFGKLIELPPDYCTNHIVEANYIYPVTGKVGIAPVIAEFIRLTLFGSLAGPQANPKGPPTMVDQLEFETTISGSLTPSVVFAPMGNVFQVADASLTAGVTRRDLHKLTVGLAIDTGSLPRVAAVRSTYFFAPLLTATGGKTELAAAEAVNQALTLKLFKRTIVVTP
jgi:hypothetical protein